MHSIKAGLATSDSIISYLACCCKNAGHITPNVLTSKSCEACVVQISLRGCVKLQFAGCHFTRGKLWVLSYYN